MTTMKRIVNRAAKWLSFGVMVVGLLFFIGFRWGLTPIPKPPAGVRIPPLLAPLTPAEITPDNGAFYYLKAAELLTGYKQSKESKAQMEALLAGHVSGETKDIEQTLTDCQEALRLVRMGAAMEFCQMPILNFNDPHTGYCSHYRQLARLLGCTGELARRNGAHEQAANEFLTVVKFGRDCASGGSVLPMLVGSVISGIGTKALRTLLLENSLPIETSQAIGAALRRVSATFPPVPETLRYELIYSKQMLDSAFKTNASWRVISRNRTHRLFDAAYGEMIQESQKPYWRGERKKVIEKWSGENISWWWIFDRPIPRIFLGLFLPSLDGVHSIAARREADLQATVIVCALAGHTRDYGEPPERLEQLILDFLPAVPVDPFDGKPFRYRREDAAWVVWSVGKDRKDDNAAWHEFKYREPAGKREGGDIYFKSTEPQDDLAAYKPCP